MNGVSGGPGGSTAEVDLRPDRPVWNRHSHCRRISSCAVLEFEPEEKPCHPILLSAWGRTALREYSGTSEGRVTSTLAQATLMVAATVTEL
jgi:hypothetical protein